MSESIFSDKLDALSTTVSLVGKCNLQLLAAGLRAGKTKVAYAVGSGGSIVAAHYLAACRLDFALAPTLIQSPMEFVLGDETLTNCQIWLFTGRGENADARATLAAAISRGATDIHIVTSNNFSTILGAVGAQRVIFHILPVADEKDGFLSTHTLISAISAIMMATDVTVGRTDELKRINDLHQAVVERRTRRFRADLLARFGKIGANDTLIVLADPGLMAAAVAIETCLWETALCAVQVTDFRNYAHGRHVWATSRPSTTVILAMVGSYSTSSWSDIVEHLPTDTRRSTLSYGNGGRLKTAISIVDALTIVEAIGYGQRRDPAKPGVTPSGRSIYAGTALISTEKALVRPVREKLKSLRRQDDQETSYYDAVAGYSECLSRLKTAHFRGLVLDYDGTVVSTEDRLKPPIPSMVQELERLMAGGLPIGIATGRGGSVGEVLRSAISKEFHDLILMGYYNGGYLQPLAVDVRVARPMEKIPIAKMASWLARHDQFSRRPSRNSGVQISMDLVQMDDPIQIVQELKSAPPVAAGEVKILVSEHSIDIVLSESSKLNVFSTIQTKIGKVDPHILCIGDSGSILGNDFELLGHPFGVSVNTVCHRPGVCWTIFEHGHRGPHALLSILKALEQVSFGVFRLDDVKFPVAVSS